MFYVLPEIMIVVFVFGCKPTVKNDSVQQKSFNLPNLNQSNLIMISLDTLRQDHLGMYGYNRDVSPFLDYLSRRSLFFTDVISQTPATNSSHYSLFTSRYLSNFYPTKLDKNKTMAGLLSLQGWETAAITAGGMLSPHFMKDKGFSYIDSKNQDFDVILDKARHWLGDHLNNRFFLFLHTYQIHPPFFSHPLYHALFRDTYEPILNLQRMKTKKLTTSNLTVEDHKYLKAAYDAKIRFCDTELEKFVQFLKNKNLYRNTVLVIISDHGESIGERHYFGHCQLYEVQLRVPLLIALPGNTFRMIDYPVENVDIMPTVFSLFHIAVPAMLQGKNLLEKLQFDDTNPDRTRVSEYENRSIRSVDGWKYIVRDRTENDELYYFPEDPAELNNLAHKYPDKIHELKSEMIKKMGISESNLRQPIKTMRIVEGVLGTDNFSLMTDRDKATMEQLDELGYID